MPDRAEAALPVLATATVSAPDCMAWATASALARSFSEPVGWRDSSLIKTLIRAPLPSSSGREYSGVFPTSKGGMNLR